MADTLFVSEKPINFNFDLYLDHGNLDSVCDTPFHLAFLSVKFD